MDGLNLSANLCVGLVQPPVLSSVTVVSENCVLLQFSMLASRGSVLALYTFVEAWQHDKTLIEGVNHVIKQIGQCESEK